MALARLGVDLQFISVTDGEASHPGSSHWTGETLRVARRDELDRALQVLGVQAQAIRLRIPDGQVKAHEDALLAALVARVGAEDLMLVTWRRDGHPDHEACAEATRRAAEAIGAAMMEYPVWMWHWAKADEPSIPWPRARRLPTSPSALERKVEAIAAFASQITADDSSAAILPPHVLARFERSFEIVFV